MTRRGGFTFLLLLVLAAAPLPAMPAAAAPAGTLSTFAGGLGAGPATSVAQTPGGLAVRGGRVVSVDSVSNLSLSPAPGVVRQLDLATGRQKVLAGMSTGGFGGDGGPATSAQLSRPIAAAIDAAGNTYVTERDNDRIRKITPGGTITTFAGNGTAGFSGDGAKANAAKINNPSGIAVSPTGDVVFADTDSYRVRKVSPSGIITTIAGTGSNAYPNGDFGPATSATLEPVALAFDGAGNLFVTDQLHRSVRKITPGGTITTVRSQNFQGSHLAVDGPGNLYLPVGSGVVRMDAAGNDVVVAGGASNPPEPPPPGTGGGGDGDGGPATGAHLPGVFGLALDGATLYLSDGYRIRRVDPAGIITTVAGNGEKEYGGDGGPAIDAQFPGPHGVRSGPTGTYFLSGYGLTDRLHRIDPAGVITTLRQGDLGGVAVDPTGNVFFSEGNQVRRLSPSGVLSTIAGTGEGGFSGDGGPAALAQLFSPQALAIDGAGSLYVNDSYNFRIRRIDTQGVITTYVGGAPWQYTRQVLLRGDVALGTVGDLAVGADGALYWTEVTPYHSGVRKATCGLVSVLTTEGRTSSSLAIDGAGSVYFTAGDEVRRVTASGAVATVAGSGGSVVLEGVPATSARLRGPSGVAIDGSGRLLFAHEGRLLQVEGVTAGRVAPGIPCDTLPDRPVWGTGYNALGQLGDGTTTGRFVPSGEKPPLTQVTAVSGGVGHSLALRADGTVWAWGWNGYGQLGDGTTSDRLRPVPVPGLTGVVAVAGGAFHSLALKGDGTVWAWGWNPFGQLGDGTTVSRLRPVPVPGLTGVTAVSAGTLHSLAVRSDGSAWAWGWNGVGQLGDGTTVDRWAPTRVPGLTLARGVAAGGLHSLAVKQDGSVWSWGWNLFGQLGDGTTVERHSPVRIADLPYLSPVTAVAAGSYHSLALRQDGSVAGWGFGNVGQVGNRSTDSSLTPVNIESVYDTVAIAAGAFHSLALGANGRVTGWGWDYFGQVAGVGRFEVQHPAVIAALDHTSAIGAGAYHSLFAYRLTP